MVNLEKKGFFVCVEGLDGCGKTTQTRLLVEKLRQQGYDALYTTEPTCGEIGEFIRRHCLYGVGRLPSVVEALLFAADRFEHIERMVAPALDRGCLVISDRYVYSSLAYQGATGLNLSWIEKINEYVISPDVAIFIDVEPETTIQRLKVDRSVMENLETQRKVREVYLKFVEKDELVKIDGSQTRQEVADDILNVLLKFLAEH